MNIKNRLKKMESGLQLDSDFYRCERDVLFKVVPRDENSEPPPEICDACHKEISLRFTTFNFNNNIETKLLLPKIIEPRTDFTREEFEAFEAQHTISRHRTYEEFLEEQKQI